MCLDILSGYLVITVFSVNVTVPVYAKISFESPLDMKVSFIPNCVPTELQRSKSRVKSEQLKESNSQETSSVWQALSLL